ncbi:MAG: aminodeoxychorismate/anthranilate synthase component II [Amphiplicatus sp.]
MILVIDNYDSFVHNLARYVREAGASTHIVRNDAASVGELLRIHPAGVILSPGPHAPKEAGVCLDLIAALPADIPLLGVCLGHQCLVEAFGGRTARAKVPLHGEARSVFHDGTGLFEGIAAPIFAGRYHSLISALPERSELVANGWSEEDELMSVRHRTRPWFGLQFHPESLLTPEGRALIGAFLRRTHERCAA